MYLRLLGEVTNANSHFLGMARGILVVSDPSGLGFLGLVRWRIVRVSEKGSRKDVTRVLGQCASVRGLQIKSVRLGQCASVRGLQIKAVRVRHFPWVLVNICPVCVLTRCLGILGLRLCWKWCGSGMRLSNGSFAVLTEAFRGLACVLRCGFLGFCFLRRSFSAGYRCCARSVRVYRVRILSRFQGSSSGFLK